MLLIKTLAFGIWLMLNSCQMMEYMQCLGSGACLFSLCVNYDLYADLPVVAI